MRYDYYLEADMSTLLYFLLELAPLDSLEEGILDSSLAEIDGFFEVKGDYYSSNLMGPRFGEVGGFDCFETFY
jgi:hypothetical protein